MGRTREKMPVPWAKIYYTGVFNSIAFGLGERWVLPPPPDSSSGRPQAFLAPKLLFHSSIVRWPIDGGVFARDRSRNRERVGRRGPSEEGT
jgi:hypothetical protein